MGLRQVSAGSWHVGDGVWVDGPVSTNPADATVLVDSGAITDAGKYLVGVSGAGSVAWVYDMERRNAANSSTLQKQRRRCASGNEDLVKPNEFTIAAGERFRCSLVGGITGEVQLSIYYKQVL